MSQRWLGAGVEDVLFTTGHLSQVLSACTAVQRALWAAGPWVYAFNAK